MNVVVNGDTTAVDPGTTLGVVVDGLGRGRRGFAAAVNEEVVPASCWDTTVLTEDDRVEILTAAQGG